MAAVRTEYIEIPGLDGVGLVRHNGAGPTGARHAHRSVCLGAVLSGVRAVEGGGVRCEALAGQVLIIPPGLAHACPELGESEYLMVSISPESFEEAGLVPSLPARPQAVDEPSRFGDLLRLADLAGKAASALERQAGLLAVMEPLCAGDAPDAPTNDPGRIDVVRECLESRFAEDLPLRKLADLAGCSPCRLNRAFCRAVGMPPHEYQVLQRVQRVKACLRRGMGLAESAAEAGFSDQSHMTRCFRRIMGMTPGVFAAGVRAPEKG